MQVLEAVESLSRFYLAVAFHDVGMNSKDPRVRHVRIAFEKVKHFREAKQAGEADGRQRVNWPIHRSIVIDIIDYRYMIYDDIMIY